MGDLRWDWDEVRVVCKKHDEESFIQLHGLLGALALLIAQYGWPNLAYDWERAGAWDIVRQYMRGTDRIRFDTLIPYEQGKSGTYAYPTLVDDYRNEFEYVYHKKPRPRVGTERLD